MKIVIADGGHAADYIVKAFHKRGNKLIVINPHRETANYLAQSNHIPVVYGAPSKIDILEEANIKDCDLFITLGFNDTNNYVACQLAKKLFGAKKCICTVSNPKYVDLYRSLGVDSVVSSTYLLASSIVSESSLESLSKTMSFEGDKIIMSEVVIHEHYGIANKMIMDINFPKTGTISCIYRKPNVIIPNGRVVILPGDKLFIVSSKKDQKNIIAFVSATENEVIKDGEKK